MTDRTVQGRCQAHFGSQVDFEFDSVYRDSTYPQIHRRRCGWDLWVCNHNRMPSHRPKRRVTLVINHFISAHTVPRSVAKQLPIRVFALSVLQILSGPKVLKLGRSSSCHLMGSLLAFNHSSHHSKTCEIHHFSLSSIWT